MVKCHSSLSEKKIRYRNWPSCRWFYSFCAGTKIRQKQCRPCGKNSQSEYSLRTKLTAPFSSSHRLTFRFPFFRCNFNETEFYQENEYICLYARNSTPILSTSEFTRLRVKLEREDIVLVVLARVAESKLDYRAYLYSLGTDVFEHDVTTDALTLRVDSLFFYSIDPNPKCQSSERCSNLDNMFPHHENSCFYLLFIYLLNIQRFNVVVNAFGFPFVKSRINTW